MNRAANTLTGILLHTLALLPLWLLYRLSDAAGFALCHIVRYRRNTIRKNLAESLPGKTTAELRKIEKQFYRNFSDYIVETLKLLHVSESEILRRMKFENIDVIDRHLAAGRSVVCYFSHCGNWEWVPSITLHSRHGNEDDVKFCQVYRPLKNKWFDALMLRLRSRFGSVSLPKKTTFRHLLEYRKNGIRTVTGFMSDQKPGSGDTTCILEFLNHPTAMISGTETLARRLDSAVAYLDMYKPRRGNYRITVRPMCDNAASTPESALTKEYAALLRQTILRDPALWLWSHKRWKNPVSLPGVEASLPPQFQDDKADNNGNAKQSSKQ
ncbi:MAG: lysophospholipid acyltransferase family protein [Muribaculaceae bacterium]|nr:lysophospholipid acyltransferase family protein [Muribaculaceae bacterium]MDE6332690.1 lysophospholipid acyltransferase family protein [Muribaculaceae bacterium]